MDEKVDFRDITATIIDLAVRGYLKIEVETREQLFGLLSREETVFHRLRDQAGRQPAAVRGDDSKRDLL